MKNAILYLLLLTYSANLLKPVMPVAMDLLAHIFWYSKHVSTVHYENGKYHVHVEAMAAAKKTDSPKANGTGKAETFFSEHYIIDTDYGFSTPPLKDIHFSVASFYIPNNYSFVEYLPPRA